MYSILKHNACGCHSIQSLSWLPVSPQPIAGPVLKITNLSVIPQTQSKGSARMAVFPCFPEPRRRRCLKTLACNFLYNILHVLPTGNCNAEGFTEQKKIGKNKTKQTWNDVVRWCRQNPETMMCERLQKALDKNRLASGRVIGETSLRSLGAGQPSAPAL